MSSLSHERVVTIFSADYEGNMVAFEKDQINQLELLKKQFQFLSNVSTLDAAVRVLKQEAIKVNFVDLGDVRNKTDRKNPGNMALTRALLARREAGKFILGNRDSNDLVLADILLSDFHEILESEITYYNDSFQSNEAGLAASYTTTREYSRGSHLLWHGGKNQNHTLLGFLLEKGYIKFDDKNKVMFSDSYRQMLANEQVKNQFRVLFFLWHSANNQGSPNYLYDLVAEIGLLDAPQKAKEDLATLPKNPNDAIKAKLENDSTYASRVCIELRKFYILDVLPLLEYSQYVDWVDRDFNAHSTVYPEVLNIPLAFVDLLDAFVNKDKLAYLFQSAKTSSYQNKFGETIDILRVETMEKAVEIHNLAHKILIQEFRKQITGESLSVSEQILNEAKKLAIEFGLPDVRYGFVSSNQIRNTGEGYTDEELQQLKEAFPNEKLVVFRKGHKPTAFPSMTHQVIDGLHLYSIRLDTSMGDRVTHVTIKDGNQIKQLFSQKISKELKDKHGKVIFSSGDQLETEVIIDSNTGVLIDSVQHVNGKAVRLPLTHRFQEKTDGLQEWRVVGCKHNETGDVDYILTSVNGDEPGINGKGQVLHPYYVEYRLVPRIEFYNQYRLTSQELNVALNDAEKLNAALADQLNSLRYSEERLHSSQRVYKGAVAATVLAGVGLTVAALLTTLPFTWHVGVAIAGSAIAVALLKAVLLPVAEMVVKSVAKNVMTLFGGNVATERNQSNELTNNNVPLSAQI